jgi:hypothetical protein
VIDNLWTILQATGLVLGILIVVFMALIALVSIVVIVREWPER